jgi:hypothetical protein
MAAALVGRGHFYMKRIDEFFQRRGHSQSSAAAVLAV